MRGFRRIFLRRDPCTHREHGLGYLQHVTGKGNMGTEAKDRQKAYRDRMRAADMAPLHDWVPEESVGLVRDIIRLLRETAPDRRARKAK